MITTPYTQEAKNTANLKEVQRYFHQVLNPKGPEWCAQAIWGDRYPQDYDDLRRAYFYSVFANRFESEEVRIDIANRLSLLRQFHFCYLVTLRLRMGDYKVPLPSQNVTKMLSNLLRNRFPHSTVLCYGAERLVLVVGSPERFPVDRVLETAEKAVKLLTDSFGLSCVAGISKSGGIGYGIDHLLRQASMADEYFYYDSSEQVISYQQKCSEIHMERGKRQCQLLLPRGEIADAFHAGDSARLSRIMQAVVSDMRTQKPKRYQAMDLCAELYYLLLNLSKSTESQTEILFIEQESILKVLHGIDCLQEYIAWINSMCAKLCRSLTRSTESRCSQQVSLIKEYIHEHCGEKITLTDVAKVMNLSRGYLSTMFKKEAGISFSDYLAQVRINKAKLLIAEQNYLMYEISDMLGFENPYYFSKIFKKVTGTSPREYNLKCLSEGLGECEGDIPQNKADIGHTLTISAAG